MVTRGLAGGQGRGRCEPNADGGRAMPTSPGKHIMPPATDAMLGFRTTREMRTAPGPDAPVNTTDPPFISRSLPGHLMRGFHHNCLLATQHSAAHCCPWVTVKLDTAHHCTLHGRPIDNSCSRQRAAPSFAQVCAACRGQLYIYCKSHKTLFLLA